MWATTHMTGVVQGFATLHRQSSSIVPVLASSAAMPRSVRRSRTMPRTAAAQRCPGAPPDADAIALLLCWYRVHQCRQPPVAMWHTCSARCHCRCLFSLPAQQPQLTAGTRSAACTARSVAHHIRSAHQLAVPHADVDADLQRRWVCERLKLLRERHHCLRLQAQQEVDAAGEHVAGVQPLQMSGMPNPVTGSRSNTTDCSHVQTTRKWHKEQNLNNNDVLSHFKSSAH